MNPIELAHELFGEMRHLTDGEQEAYEKALRKNMIPVEGPNFFDLLDDGEGEVM